MQHVYLHEKENMYKRLHVADPQPYLDDGWFLSIDDHLAHVAKMNKTPVETHLFDAPPAKIRSRSRKKPEAE